jgi:hypothetical protein
MANNFSTKGISVISPKAELEWCKYLEPDTKFNADGELSVNLLFDPEDEKAKEFIGKLENLRDTAYAELKENLGPKGNQWSTNPITQTHYDKDGNETGKVLIKAKLKDVAKRKAQGKQYTIKAVGPNKEVLKVPVGNGSIGVVGAFAYAYEMASNKKVGVTLQFQKLRVFDLVELADGGDDDLFTADSEPDDVFAAADASANDDLDF